MSDFRIYTLPGCGACKDLKQTFEAGSVSFQEVTFADDPLISAGMTAFVGEVRVPVTVHFPTRQVFVGSGNPALLSLLGAPPKTPDRGLGDTLKRFTAWLGIKPCAACVRRAEALNALVSYKKENGGASNV